MFSIRAEDQLDKRETTMDRRDDELQLREADVTRREGVLDRLTDDIGRMISDIAERLGVGDSLRPIRCGKPFRLLPQCNTALLIIAGHLSQLVHASGLY